MLIWGFDARMLACWGVYSLSFESAPRFLITVFSLKPSASSETLRVPRGKATLPTLIEDDEDDEDEDDDDEDDDDDSVRVLVTLAAISEATVVTLSKFSFEATLAAVSVATLTTSSVLMELTFLTKL